MRFATRTHGIMESFFLHNFAFSNCYGDLYMYEYKGIEITWLGHDGFKIQDGSEILVIDPFKLDHDVRADILLISHEHFDHCNSEDLKKVLKSNTVVVAIPACKEELAKASAREIKIVKPGDTVRVGTYEVRAIPAYNTTKFNESGKPFHPKADLKVGYVIKTKNGTTIYHTGDSDLIPEMDNLKPDIALLPVSGTYVMTADEALQAVERIKPGMVIPMHWGAIVGSKRDAEKFKDGAKVRVEILEKES